MAPAQPQLYMMGFLSSKQLQHPFCANSPQILWNVSQWIVSPTPPILTCLLMLKLSSWGSACRELGFSCRTPAKPKLVQYSFRGLTAGRPLELRARKECRRTRDHTFVQCWQCADGMLHEMPRGWYSVVWSPLLCSLLGPRNSFLHVSEVWAMPAVSC